MEINVLGETIGKYKIIGHIDRGGMADVYKALHPELNRVVALKVLNRALVRSPEMLERFRREARAIAALRHPNIVQVFDLDVVDGLYFMVMEYVEGETLSQRLTHLCQCGEHMPLSEVLHIVVAVGEALQYAHEQGMLHRDIKPANIMFRGDGSVVLTDFGVAKILSDSSDLTASGAVAGTPAYMAPEQWTDDKPDKRSDIYSLGVVLYQMVTGELPFNAETPGRLIFKHISEPPLPPHKLCADIPLDLERIILRALAKDPENRYQTAQELVDDLQGVVYKIESTAPTGIFKRSLMARDKGQAARSAPAETSRSKPSARRTLVLRFGAVAIITLVAFLALYSGGFIGSALPADTPDVTGTALAVRLATLEATLAVTLTPSRAPAVALGTAAPTSASAENPSVSPMPGTCLLMTLVEDINYSNTNWWGSVNARLNKTWRLRNDGDCPWPEDTVLVAVDDQDFGLDEPFEVGALPPGADTELSIPLRVPSEPGKYEGYFQLQTADGESIGEPLAVKLEARLRVTPTPAASEPVRIVDWRLIDWQDDRPQYLWRGKLQFWATGGTGQYVWYRDTLENPLPGDVMEFEWGICRDFYGSVWVSSGDAMDHLELYVPYPGSCE